MQCIGSLHYSIVFYSWDSLTYSGPTIGLQWDYLRPTGGLHWASSGTTSDLQRTTLGLQCLPYWTYLGPSLSPIKPTVEIPLTYSWPTIGLPHYFRPTVAYGKPLNLSTWATSITKTNETHSHWPSPCYLHYYAYIGWFAKTGNFSCGTRLFICNNFWTNCAILFSG